MSEQNGRNQHEARGSATAINTIALSDDLNNSSFSLAHDDHRIIPAPPNTSPNHTPAFISPNIQMPFTPKCAVDVEVYQRWKAGYAANHQLYESREVSNVPAWNWSSPTAADGTINMTDSGVDLSEPLQYQDASDECPTALNIQEVCKDPDQCELSPDMVDAMQRFSVPHVCQYDQAKRLLVDKVSFPIQIGLLLD